MSGRRFLDRLLVRIRLLVWGWVRRRMVSLRWDTRGRGSIRSRVLRRHRFMVRLVVMDLMLAEETRIRSFLLYTEEVRDLYSQLRFTITTSF